MAEVLKIELPVFFEVGKNKITHLLEIFSDHRIELKHAVLLGDRKTFKIGGDAITHDFKKANIKINKYLINDSDNPNVNRVNRIIDEKKPDLVIGFGGGKVLDVAKLAAGKSNAKFISIPTTLSNDGIASPISVIKDKNTIPISHITKAPYGVIVDVDIIKKAPLRHVKAGIGDLISNLSAVFDVRLAQSKGIEKTNTTALTLAEAGGINLLDFRHESIKANEFLLCLTRGLIKSGIAMCIVGSSRPASGSEHKISHSIDHLYSPRKSLHGEQTGIATIFTMALQENQYLHKVRKFYTHIAFPQRIKKLFLNKDQFVKAVHNATKIRPERYTILEEKRLKPKDIKNIIGEFNL
jgi:glycerol-1-phosphate dehydrogenase [NAD(P)+]